MINSFIFILFYLFILFSGRGLIIIVDKLTKQNYLDSKIYDYPIWIFYPLLFLFFIGNSVLIFNFFTGSKSLLLIIFVFLPIFFNIFNLKNIQFVKFNRFAYFFALFFLGMSSNTITFHQDSASYHLAYQEFIRTEKIVLGLSNLHVRYGFSSMSDYINSFFWFKENFLFVHFVNLIFIGTFYIFLIWIVSNKNDSNDHLLVFTITLYGILDNFGIEGGKNGFFDIDSVGKQDGAFGILFFFSNLFIFKYINNKINFSNKDLRFLIYLILFSIQFRIFGFTLLLGLLFIVYKYKNKIDFRIFYFPTLIGLLWIFKNFLITSCLVFPIPQTCLNSKWKYPYLIESQNKELRSFHNAFNIRSENLIEWYIKWSERYLNYYISVNFILSLVFILVVSILFFKINKNFNKKIVSSFYIFIFLFLWLVSAPTIRFGYGIFLTLFIYISYFFKNPRIQIVEKLVNKSNFLVLLIFLCVLTTPLFNNYKFSNNYFKVREIIPEKIQYIKNSSNWGYSVETKEKEYLEFCWINKNCIPPVNYRIDEKFFYSYRLIFVESGS